MFSLRIFDESEPPRIRIRFEIESKNSETRDERYAS